MDTHPNDSREAPQLNPFGDDSAVLGWIDARIARTLSTLRDAIRPVYAVHMRATRGGIAQIGTDTVIPIVTVPAGRMYNLNSVTITGADPWTAFAQPAALCIGRAQLDPITSTEYANDVVQPGLIAPAAVFYNDDVVWARGNDDVYVVVKKGTAGNITVSLTYDDWPENEQTPTAL